MSKATEFVEKYNKWQVTVKNQPESPEILFDDGDTRFSVDHFGDLHIPDAVYLNPEDALKLGKWLIETFADYQQLVDYCVQVVKLKDEMKFHKEETQGEQLP